MTDELTSALVDLREDDALAIVDRLLKEGADPVGIRQMVNHQAGRHSVERPVRKGHVFAGAAHHQVSALVSFAGTLQLDIQAKPISKKEEVGTYLNRIKKSPPDGMIGPNEQIPTPSPAAGQVIPGGGGVVFGSQVALVAGSRSVPERDGRGRGGVGPIGHQAEEAEVQEFVSHSSQTRIAQKPRRCAASPTNRRPHQRAVVRYPPPA